MLDEEMDVQSMILLTQGWKAMKSSNLENLDSHDCSQSYGMKGLNRKTLEYFSQKISRDWDKRWVPEFWTSLKTDMSAENEIFYTISNHLRQLVALLRKHNQDLLLLEQGLSTDSEDPHAGASHLVDQIGQKFLFTSPPFFKDALHYLFLAQYLRLKRETQSGFELYGNDGGDVEEEIIADGQEQLNGLLDDIRINLEKQHDFTMSLEASASFYLQEDPLWKGREFGLGPELVLLEDFEGEPSSNWMEDTRRLCRMLWAIGLGPICQEASSLVLYNAMKDHIRRVGKGHLAQGGGLALSLSWIQHLALPYLSLLLPHQQRQDAYLDRWRSLLETAVHDMLGQQLSEELFDLIVEYPDSRPVLGDLRTCLCRSSAPPLPSLTASFLSSLSNRLLTPGASTADILSHYVSTVRALCQLDPSGVVLDRVSGPIRAYLRGRKDTVRCVVAMLTEDGGGHGVSLEDPTGTGGTQPLADNSDSEDDDCAGGEDFNAELAAMEKWTPDPLESDPRVRVRHSGDILRQLVHTVGSREPIIAEYRARLADRLLTKGGYDAAGDLRTLELLKLRFGEPLLLPCEVMLQDLSLSRRLNALCQRQAGATRTGQGGGGGEDEDDSLAGASPTPFQSPALGPTASWQTAPGFGVTPPISTVYRRGAPGRPPVPVPLPTLPQGEGFLLEPPAPTPAGARASMSASWQPERATGVLPMEAVSATIISALFWPPLPEETFELPEAVEDVLAEYAGHYHTLKAPRKLKWLPNLGSVKLELTFEDGSREYSVSPLEASIVLLFQERPQWTATQIARQLATSPGTVKRRIATWLNQGVVSETPSPAGDDVVYSVASKLGGDGPTANEDTPAGDQDQGEEEKEAGDAQSRHWAVHESYVMGMLSTFAEGLPVERIHNMLKMFVVNPPYDKTLPELLGFLGKLVAEDKLEARDGKYKRK